MLSFNLFRKQPYYLKGFTSLPVSNKFLQQNYPVDIYLFKTDDWDTRQCVKYVQS